MFSRANCDALQRISRQKICRLLMAPLALVVAVHQAQAGVLYNFDGTLDGKTQDATAEFTFGAGTLQIELHNLVVNPTSVIQNISALLFTIASPPTLTVASLTSSSATKRTISGGGGTYVDGASGVATDWSLIGPTGQVLELNWNNGSGPDETIVGFPDGSNVYSNANGSIAGNGPHNPFLFPGPVIFNLSITGVTAGTTLVDKSVLMQFGTENGRDYQIVGIPDGPPPPPGRLPEPASLLVFAGLGLLLSAPRCRSRRKADTAV